MGPTEPRIDRLVALAAVGLVAFNYPLLRIFEQPALALGLPVLYVYLFVVWLAVIALVALMMERRAPRAVPEPESAEPDEDSQPPDA